MKKEYFPNMWYQWMLKGTWMECAEIWHHLKKGKKKTHRRKMLIYWNIAGITCLQVGYSRALLMVPMKSHFVTSGVSFNSMACFPELICKFDNCLYVPWSLWHIFYIQLRRKLLTCHPYSYRNIVEDAHK